MRSRYLDSFIVLVDVAAVTALLFVPVAALRDQVALALTLAALGLIAGMARVRIPGLGTHMSAVDPLVFCALAAIGPLAACVVATGAVIGSVLRPGAKPQARHFAFNLGNVFLSTAAAGTAFHALGGSPGLGVGTLLGPLAAAVAVYFLTNSILLTVTIKLDGAEVGLLAQWRQSFLWTIPSYVGGLVMGVGLYAAVQTHVVWTLILAIPGCWLLFKFFGAHAMSQSTRKRTV